VLLLQDAAEGTSAAETSADILLSKPLDWGKFEAAMKGLEKQLELASA
jgi:hypothetical protein